MPTILPFTNDANTKALWHMDGTVGSAGKKLDSSSIANSLVEGNTPTSQTGQITPTTDGAYGFNGSTGNQHVYAPYNSAYDGQTAFTVEGWVYFNSLPSANPTGNVELIRHWSGSAGWILETTGGNNFIWELQASGFQAVTGTTTITTGVWYYVAATYDGSNMKLYINGVQEGGNQALSGTMSTYNAPLYFGIQDNLTQRQLDGRMDEWRISNVARSASDISTYYNYAAVNSGFFLVS